MYLYIPCLRMGEGERMETRADRGWHTCRSALRLTDSGLVAVLALAGLETGEPRPGEPAGSSSSWGTGDPVGGVSANVWGGAHTNTHTHKTVNTKTLVIKEQWKVTAVSQTPCAEQESKITGQRLNTKLHFFFFAICWICLNVCGLTIRNNKKKTWTET